jgi:transcriptional regulator NrdR family protein
MGNKDGLRVYGEGNMVLIKKRDGRKEPFVPEKIIVSAIKSGAPPDYARTIAQDIERSTRDGATTHEIKTKVLSMLKSRNPEWERNWVVYDSAVKKRTT